MSKRQDNPPVTEADLLEGGARIFRAIGDFCHLLEDMLYERAEKERK